MVEFLKSSVSSQPIITTILFILIYILVTVLGLPGAALLSLSAGMLFGLWKGTAVVVVASGSSAITSFLLARYLFQEYVTLRFSVTIEKVNRGIKKEGLFYLFFLRLVPGIPFPVLNMSFGVTRMKLFPYWITSQIAMIPASILYVNVGTGVTDLNSIEGVVNLRTILSLAAIGTIPLIIKFIHKRIVQRKHPN